MARYRRWKPTETLWLPGDKESVFDFEYRRAVKRDGRLNPQERQVYTLIWACKSAKQSYWWWECGVDNPCTFCWEAMEV